MHDDRRLAVTNLSGKLPFAEVNVKTRCRCLAHKTATLLYHKICTTFVQRAAVAVKIQLALF